MDPAFIPFACFLLACSSTRQPVPGSLQCTFWRPASLAKNHRTIPARPLTFGSSAFRFGALILRVNTNQAEPHTGVDTNYTDFHEFRVDSCNSCLPNS